MALYHDQIDDFVVATLDRWINQKKWADISLPFQHYTFVEQFMGKKVMEDGGHTLKWPVQIPGNSSYERSGLFGTISQPNVQNIMLNAEVKWAKGVVKYAYDIDEEAFQSPNYLVTVRYLEARHHKMMNDYFEAKEEELWSAPSSDSLANRQMAGVPFWLQKNATEGFNGGNPSGHSSGAGGISTSTVPNWSNWTFSYSTVDRDDFVAKVRKAIEFTKFKAPHAYNALKDGPPKYGFFTTYRLKAELEALLEGRNDNLGTDLAWGMDKATFKSIPLNWVPSLESSTSVNYASDDPFYGVNFNQFQYFVKSGAHMRMHKPKDGGVEQYSVRTVVMDTWDNTRCLNRREAGFVGYQA